MSYSRHPRVIVPRFRMTASARILDLLLVSSLVAITAAEPPRAARSVHLGFPGPEAELFYNEMIIDKSVDGSYFMAAGWDTGYFGLQQLESATNKVILFSVWDSTHG